MPRSTLNYNLAIFVKGTGSLNLQVATNSRCAFVEHHNAPCKIFQYNYSYMYMYEKTYRYMYLVLQTIDRKVRKLIFNCLFRFIQTNYESSNGATCRFIISIHVQYFNTQSSNGLIHNHANDKKQIAHMINK